MPQRRRRKRLGTSTPHPPPAADAPNRVWAVDFQFDATTDGRPIKIVSIIDEHTRVSLLHVVERTITAELIVTELELSRHWPPAQVLRMDNGPELVSPAQQWLWDGEGRPVTSSRRDALGNGYIESFNARVREECL